MAWSLIIHKNTITNWSTVLQTSPQSLCFYPSFPFSWRQDTFAILQSYVHHLVYVIPIVVCFHKWFNKFRLSKNLLTNIFFAETCVSPYIWFHDEGSCWFLFFSYFNPADHQPARTTKADNDFTNSLILRT